MISSEEIPTCFNCQKPLPYGKSVKKDLPICQSCFDHIYELERLSLRKLSFDDADHILDNIYLGPEGSAIDLPYLQSLNIDRIVAAATYVVIKFPSELEYMHLHLDDSPQEDLMPHFEPVIAFIQKRPESNVLVHCASGISRSASFVIAYVMKTRGLGYQEGWEFVMSKRSIVYPNAGFKQQLIKYGEICKSKE
ncbi:hypothetical protein FGO68_gene8845 [Halteria grandinella]|uniref:protein-tyrosine-phosphatase n=1 Tax=Halteria grandinella TaxID=5974 RepID=A0A8J8SYP9_HALGN|nr:hypothetical protein FGO68_gene8845 [Halteria grandinella]